MTLRVNVNCMTCLKLLFVLNLLDGVLTYFGISSGFIEELNPLLKGIASSFVKMSLFKLLIPSLLICGLMLIVKKGKSYRKNFAHGLIYMTTGVYGTVLCLHGVWLFRCLFISI